MHSNRRSLIPGLLGVGLSILLLGPGLAVGAPEHAATPAPGPCAEPAAVPSLRCAKSPTPLFAPDGRLWLTWYGRGHIYLQHSDDQGESFSDPLAVNRTPEAVDDQGEDRPQVALGPQGEIYLLWTRKLDRPHTGHVRFSRSLDGGRTFSDPVNVNDDGLPIAHRFPIMKVNPSGTVFVAWIDKRDLEAAKQANTPYPGAALYFSRSRNRGASFEPNRKLTDQSCECCRIAMSLDATGNPLVLYRHVFPGSIRDHALIRISSGGEGTPPRRVSEDRWQLDGCPHHGPAMASQGGIQHLAWFTAGDNRKGLFYARADQSGISEPMAFGQPGAERPMLAVQGERVVLVWKRFAGDRTRVMSLQSEDGGRHWQPEIELASTAGASDHPLLVTLESTAKAKAGSIFLSWQTTDEGYRLLPVLSSGGNPP